MKKTFTAGLLAMICCATVLTTSCKDDKDDLSFAPPSAAKFKELRQQALNDITQTATFAAEDGINFTSEKGAKIRINGGCLQDEDFNVVTGDVQLSFIEIYDRGTMVATNKPVMGRDGSGNKLPLVTGGEYNLTIEQNGKQLRSGCAFNVSIPAANTGGIDGDMILWNGVIDENGNLEFEAVKETGQEAGLRVNQVAATYDIWSGEFGWTNVDRFYSDPRPKTQIKVHVPSAYNNENASVYLAYQGEPNVLAQLDTYDTVDRFFSEHYGFIPIGMTLHVIFVSESNDNFIYAIKRATIVENGAITIAESELQSTSQSNLKSIVSALN